MVRHIFGPELKNAFKHGEEFSDEFRFGGNIVTNDLQAWWKHDEGTGITLTDYGGSTDGTIVGANFWDNMAPDGSPCGTYDGSTNYINGLGTGLDRTDGESVTFMIAFYSDIENDATPRELISRYIGGTGANYLLYLRNATDEFSFNVALGASETYGTSDFNLVTSTWYILTLVYTFGTGSTAAVYKNGAAVTGSWTAGDGDGTPSTGTGYTIIGAVDTSATPDDVADIQFWQGRIGDVLLYTRILTQSEITANYNALKGRYNL